MKNEKVIKDFLSYLENERKFSPHTLRGYKIDLFNKSKKLINTIENFSGIKRKAKEKKLKIKEIKQTKKVKTSSKKTKIKKIIKTENKNLCFKDQINFPKYILQQTKITKQRQQNASTMQLLQNQNDGL